MSYLAVIFLWVYVGIPEALYWQSKADSMQRIVEVATWDGTEANTLKGYKTEQRNFQQKADNEWRLIASKGGSKNVSAVQAKPQEAAKVEESSIKIVSEDEMRRIRQERKDTIAQAKAVVDTVKAVAQVEKREEEVASPLPYLGIQTKANAYQGVEDIPEMGGEKSLEYKIQLGAYGKMPSVEVFGGLYPLIKFRLAGGITRFYAGEFAMYAEAVRGLELVRSKGFTGAFIVCFRSGENIGLEAGKRLEKEQK